MLERRTALAAIGGLLVGACGSGPARADKQASGAMSNKDNYLAAKAAYNARDLDRCLSYYAPDHQIMSKPTPPGREQIRAFFENTFAAWPDVQLVVVNAVAEEDWVAGRCILTATHSAAVMGVAPTGKKIEASFWDLHRFNSQGLIAQTWNLTDNLAIMQQLGLAR